LLKDIHPSFGGSCADLLIGGVGQDWLLGGLGNTTLQGGAGVDEFVLAKAAGIDRILDVQNKSDRLSVAGRLQFSHLAIRRGTGAEAENTLIQLKGSHEVLAVLMGVSANQITRADFLLK
jgi:Ca2+-binding RTX toxin-like protein